MPDTPQMSLYWILVVEFLNGLGTGMAMMYSFEFTMAQTPNRMRGIMMGVVIFNNRLEQMVANSYSTVMYIPTMYYVLSLLSLPVTSKCRS